MITIYHNQECSKSNGALCLLKETGKEFKTINYLTDIPAAEEIKDILQKLAMKPKDLIRTNEPVYMEKYEGKIFTDEDWIQIMIENPILIERPIVICGDKAIIARPPEKVLEFVNEPA